MFTFPFLLIVTLCHVSGLPKPSQLEMTTLPPTSIFEVYDNDIA